jgi:hypothetical protein
MKLSVGRPLASVRLANVDGSGTTPRPIASEYEETPDGRLMLSTTAFVPGGPSTTNPTANDTLPEETKYTSIGVVGESEGPRATSYNSPVAGISNGSTAKLGALHAALEKMLRTSATTRPLYRVLPVMRNYPHSLTPSLCASLYIIGEITKKLLRSASLTKKSG